MKRIIVSSYGSQDALELRDSDPPTLQPGQVLVRLMAAGVNPVDAYMLAGKQGYAPQLPFCPGNEGAGIIERIGPEATDQGDGADSKFHFQPGDRVYVAWSQSGTYGQWCIAQKHQLFPLPMGMNWEQAASLFVNYYTAYRALFSRGGARSGERILIHGASGGVGMAALQWCSFRALDCWGTAGSDEGRNALLERGAKGAVNHGANTAASSDAQHKNSSAGASTEHTSSSELHQLANSLGGFHLIVEMRAEENLEVDTELLAPGGRIVVVGSRGSLEFTPRKTMGIEADIRGLALRRTSPEEMLNIHRELEKATASGDIQPVIQGVYSLEQAGQAQQDLFNLPSRGKIVLRCSNEE